MVPQRPKIYHIVHVDRLSSIIDDGYIYSDEAVRRLGRSGTEIGLPHIKERRRRNHLSSIGGITVAQCVPFYFCPRSVMLFVLSKRGAVGLEYNDGQKPIVHLEADLHDVVRLADQRGRRWAFTTSNAGAAQFEDYSDLKYLCRIDWEAVSANDWREGLRYRKQAEFLVEGSFPWRMVERIGVMTPSIEQSVLRIIPDEDDQPEVAVRPDWYY